MNEAQQILLSEVMSCISGASVGNTQIGDMFDRPGNWVFTGNIPDGDKATTVVKGVFISHHQVK